MHTDYAQSLFEAILDSAILIDKAGWIGIKEPLLFSDTTKKKC